MTTIPYRRLGGFMFFEALTLSMAIGFLCFIGLSAYQKEQVGTVLTKKLATARYAYNDRDGNVLHFLNLAGAAHRDRAPGQYQRIVVVWAKYANSSDQDRGQDPTWLTTARKAEQQKVNAVLKDLDVSQDDLKHLAEKLDKISPQLSDEETSKLERLALPSNLMKLADITSDTARGIFRNLKELGLSELGLAENGIREKMEHELI